MSTLTENDTKNTKDESGESDAVTTRFRGAPLLHNYDRLLASVQQKLPALPAAGVKFQRSVNAFWYGAARNAFETVRSSLDSASDAAMTGAKTVLGQAKAQTRIAADKAADEASAAAEDLDSTASSMADAVDSAANEIGRGYAEWTKDDLYDRAQELDIEGRSTMTKDELVEALRSRR